MVARIIAAVFLTFAFLDHAATSNSCSYIYKLPKTSGSQCDAKGGIDADLLDRVWALNGGIQGIKLIGQANMDVLKNFQNQMRQVQQQYGQYGTILGNLKRQIDDLKMILNAIPDEPYIDDDDGDNPRMKRATDPNKAIRSALSLAEWNLINVTMSLHDVMKKREQLETTLQKRIKDQEAKVQAILSKIKNIENSMASIPAAAPLVGKPISSSMKNEIANLTNKVVDLIVEVNVMTRLSGNKVKDVTTRLDSIKTPLSKQEQTFKDLKNITSGMNATFAKVESGVQDLFNTVVNASTQLDPLYQQLRVDENAMYNKYNKFLQDYNKVNNRILQEQIDLKRQKAELSSVNFTLSGLDQNYGSIKTQYDKYQKDYKAISQYPILRMGSLDYYAHQALIKQNATLAQLDRMVKVIEKQVAGLNKTITHSASG